LLIAVKAPRDFESLVESTKRLELAVQSVTRALIDEKKAGPNRVDARPVTTNYFGYQQVIDLFAFLLCFFFRLHLRQSIASRAKVFR